MPLQGNLRDFSTTQLLNLVNLSNKTGTLVIYEGVRTGQKDANQREKMTPGKERARIAFKVGKLIAAALSGQDSSLVAVLNKAGKLSNEQAKIIRQRAKDVSDKAVALLLINADYVSKVDVVNAIQQHTLDVVYNLLSWREGPFYFEDNALPGSDRILVPIDLENIIMEGSRQVEEIDQLTAHLPNLDLALRFPDNAREKFKGMHLSVEEWRIVSFINGKNTIRQIARANNMSEVQIRRIIYGLEQAGLIQIMKPEPTKVAKPADKGLVQRLIDRINSI